jgi:hypothetical protein
MARVGVCLVLLSVMGVGCGQGRVLNISPGGPLKSLTEARDAIRALKAAGPLTEPVRVVIADGVYPLSEPLVLTPADSGTAAAPIRYEAAPGAHPIFTAGRRLGGFKVAADGTWSLDLPEVRDGRWQLEQLYVNGRAAVRARLPKKGYFYTLRKSAGDARRSVELDPADTAALAALTPEQLKDVCLVAYFSWESARLRVAGFDPKSQIVTTTGPAAWELNGFYSSTTRQRYHLENLPNALTEPGEWQLGRDGVLKYQPRPGEDPATAAVWAPVGSRFIAIAGDPQLGLRVEHIAFVGLSFQHAAYVLPPGGHSDGQAEVSLPAAIELDGATAVTFERCELAHLGAWAMWFRSGCRDCAVRRCRLWDMGAGGIKVGTGWDVDNPDDLRLTRSIVMDNNIIHGGGRLHHGAHGIWIGHSSDNQVTHNDIADFNYTAVSAGWRWGYGASVAKRNTITFNRLHHLGWCVMSDMGGVYTLGPSEGTVVSNNVITDVNDYGYYGRGGWGLYNDEGSSGILMENNLVLRTRTGGYHLHYGKDLVIRNNIFADQREFQLQHSRNEADHHQFDFTNNIVWWRTGQLFNGDWTVKQIHLGHNVYWNAAGAPVRFGNLDWPAWLAKGVDQDSVVADPLFVDPEHGDYRLKPDSPALKMGFKPFDPSQAGVYGEAAWVALAAAEQYPAVEYPAPPPPPPPLTFNLTLDDLPTGGRPPGAEVHVEGKGDSIGVVSQPVAPGGHKSLEVVDAPGLQFIYDPHFCWQLSHAGGVSTFSFDLRCEAGVNMYVEWRDWAAAPYKVGPSLWWRDGKLLYAGQPLCDAPAGGWVHLVMTAGLGPQANGKWDLTVTPAGGAPRSFPGLACGSPDFKALTWLGVSSMADAKTVFYLANLRLDNAK